jgi:histidinol phosphatase-like PHP family hydrolase
LEINSLNRDFQRRRINFTVLRSAEMNLSPVGEGDMSADALEELDLVLGCFHSALRRSEDQTSRYIAGLRNPHIQILGHPQTRIYNYREGLTADWSRVFAEAARLDKAVEIDGYADRQDLRVSLLKLARVEGVRISLGTDAHHPEQLAFMELGLAAAALAKIEPERIVNFMPVDELRAWAAGVRREQQNRARLINHGLRRLCIQPAKHRCTEFFVGFAAARRSSAEVFRQPHYESDETDPALPHQYSPYIRRFARCRAASQRAVRSKCCTTANSPTAGGAGRINPGPENPSTLNVKIDGGKMADVIQVLQKTLDAAHRPQLNVLFGRACRKSRFPRLLSRMSVAPMPCASSRSVPAALSRPSRASAPTSSAIRSSPPIHLPLEKPLLKLQA